MEEKLTSAKLYRKIHKPFLEMGFLEFVSAGFHLYTKVVAEGWYLTVLPNIDRFYDDQFTMQMFLCKETLLGDYYNHTVALCNLRPHHFLEELSYDYWWSGLQQKSFDDFLDKFSNIVEQRIYDKINELSEIVNASEWIKQIVTINNGVYSEYLRTFGSPSDIFENIDIKKPIKTPKLWIEATEKYYEQNGPFKLFSGLAADMAFREWMAREYASRMKK